VWQVALAGLAGNPRSSCVVSPRLAMVCLVSVTSASVCPVEFPDQILNVISPTHLSQRVELTDLGANPLVQVLDCLPHHLNPLLPLVDRAGLVRWFGQRADSSPQGVRSISASGGPAQCPRCGPRGPRGPGGVRVFA
jgi:hypothetical protein